MASKGKNDMWESVEPIEDLRRGEWGFAPEILAAGMDLPRPKDGAGYEPEHEKNR